MGFKNISNYLAIISILLLLGLYITNKRENLKILNGLSTEKEIKAEFLISQTDSSKKCVYFEGYKRGFYADNFNQTTKFTIKLSEDSKGNSCITEILADGNTFYKPNNDNKDYCIDIKVPQISCNGRRNCSISKLNCY